MILLMDLQAVQIQNFMSIKHAAISLTGQGLTLINGINHDNPSLDNNGAGKSTVIEAIVYALFGRTLRGAKGDAVVNSIAKKDCTVALMLTDDNGDKYVIVRNRKHRQRKNASILLFTPNGAEQSQDITPKSEKAFDDEICRIIGMDYTTFVSSVVYSDTSFKFTSATDAELKQVFDKMLGIEVWSDALMETRRRLAEAVANRDVFRRREQDARKRMDMFGGQLVQNQRSFSQFEAAEKYRMESLREELTRKQAELQTAEAEKREAESRLAVVSGEVEEAQKLKDAAKAEAENENTEYEKYSADRLQWETDASELGNIRRQYESAVATRERMEAEIPVLRVEIEEAERNKTLISTQPMTCPYCGQPMTEERRKSAVQEADGIIQKAREALSQAESALEEQKRLESQYGTEYDSMRKDIDQREQELKERNIRLQNSAIREKAEKASEAYNAAFAAASKASSELSIKSSKVESAKASVAETFMAIQAGARENPYRESVNFAKTSMDEAQNETEEYSEKADKAEAVIASLKFWETAFGNQGIKSFILDSVTPFLTKQSNFYLSKLAGNRIAVEFETQTHLKTGETREKFAINVTNLDGGNAYSLNSGGEKKRVDLAVYFALQDLVASRANKKFNVSFCDEAFDALDENGIESVMSLLREIAQEKSSVFVITHSDALKSAFSNVITIEKSGGFSTIS